MGFEQNRLAKFYIGQVIEKNEAYVEISESIKLGKSYFFTKMSSVLALAYGNKILESILHNYQSYFFPDIGSPTMEGDLPG